MKKLTLILAVLGLLTSACKKVNEKYVTGEWKCTRVYSYSQSKEQEIWDEYLKVTINQGVVAEFSYGNPYQDNGQTLISYTKNHCTYNVEGDSIFFKYIPSGYVQGCEIIELNKKSLSWKERYPNSDNLYEYNFERVK